MTNVTKGPQMAVDLDRLERGVQLSCVRLGQGRYRVSGGASEHWVEVGASGARPTCDCGDYLWRDRVCKHILAALLQEGASAVISQIGPMVARLKGAAA